MTAPAVPARRSSRLCSAVIRLAYFCEIVSPQTTKPTVSLDGPINPVALLKATGSSTDKEEISTLEIGSR